MIIKETKLIEFPDMTLIGKTKAVVIGVEENGVVTEYMAVVNEVTKHLLLERWTGNFYMTWSNYTNRHESVSKKLNDELDGLYFEYRLQQAGPYTPIPQSPSVGECKKI